MSEGTERKGLYRSRDGAIFGVCKGVANYMDVSVFWMRALLVFIFFLSGIWPVVVIYILAALLMKPEPVLPLRTDEDYEFYNSYVTSRTAALHRLKRTYDNIERRIRRMEDIVTNREYDWDRRLGE
ncbi:MAG: envelope stress response membrane protein PspC [FCB group bacterium]|jgi:phage shock protein C|nr:envelope stress response membrane protein PspC [FCB group bacterium]